LKKILFGSAFALLATIGSALGADLSRPVYKEPAAVVSPVYNWSGFYIGVNAGGSQGNFDPTTSAAFNGAGYFAATSITAINAVGAQSIKPTGFTGGLEAGYNWQVSSIVLGIEGDVESLRLSGSASSFAPYPCCGPPAGFNISANASTSWLATVRGRVGVASDNWLFFGTGGAAFTTLKGNFTGFDNCANFVACSGGIAYPTGLETASFNNGRAGYTLGGGGEVGVASHWRIKAEYLYVNFGGVSAVNTVTFAGAPLFGSNLNPFTHSIDLKANIVRLGLNYNF
jgi:outer membrane immunogenic protein